jgi:hypothetical protein
MKIFFGPSFFDEKGHAEKNPMVSMMARLSCLVSTPRRRRHLLSPR